MSFQIVQLPFCKKEMKKYYQTSLTYLKLLHSTTMTTIKFYYEFIFLFIISKMIKIEHFFAGCVINLQGSKILPKGTVYDRATVESHKPLINS